MNAMKGKRSSALTVAILVLAIASSARPQLEDEPTKTEICELCRCSEPELFESGVEPFMEIDCVHTKSKDSISLRSIVWPEKNKDIVISVQGFDMASVPKIPRNEFIVSLQLKNNNIRTTWPMAFSDIVNLKTLSLAENQLAEVTPDMFQNMRLLKRLDLSDNKLSEFNKLDFDQLKSLNTLILNGNSIKDVPIHALNGVPTLKELYLSRNEIYFLDFKDTSKSLQGLEKIKVLDFSFNKLTIITKETFQHNQLLEFLDLSHNNIKNIDQDAFIKCNMLKTINLSSNEIKTLATFPPKINTILLSKNMLTEWPMFPESLKVLDISRNELLSTYNKNDNNFNNIEILNVSRNVLQNFDIERPLPKLLILDISFNSLEVFPTNIDSNIFPSIEELIIDGNPINELKFDHTLYLKRFSASYLTKITEIKKANLKLKGKTSLLSENTEECIEVVISHCDKLSNIETDAFSDLSLCKLDLSYNNIKKLEKNVGFGNVGINLQGNPWDCSCDLQWMLDELLVDLYENHPMLLNELRCQSPRSLNGLRFVHWYQWGERAFCSDSKKARHSGNYIQTSESTESDPEMLSTSAILLLVALLVAIVIIGSLIAYLVSGKLRQRRHIQRLKLKKRQEPSDAQKPIQNGENTALTNV